MIVLGLTGSIGMGKTSTARLFREEGAAVFDVDAAVHALYAPGGAATPLIAAAFPGVLDAEGAVDRKALAAEVLDDPKGLKRLEAIVHPLVRARREEFLDAARWLGAKLAVVDIPLLFETGQEDQLDKIVVVTAPPEIQRQRVMSRPGMTEEKFQALLARQTPDAEKRVRADFIIDTSKGMDAAREQVRDIIAAVSTL